MHSKQGNSTKMSLNILIFLGSVRESTPPKPARLGARVATACRARLEATSQHTTIIDPLDIDVQKPFKPHFAYPEGKAPAELDTLAAQIGDADAYVMVSPEYNHAMSPALSSLLNHFGSSLFSYKPSAIVTYSAGQWGGARAAVNMRTFLSELGCLPVSAMIQIPKAQEVLDENGAFYKGVDGDGWHSYFDRTLMQLNWWARAASHQRSVDSESLPGAFKSDPAQRNAP